MTAFPDTRGATADDEGDATLPDERVTASVVREAI
jgi:hypothetical protein